MFIDMWYGNTTSQADKISIVFYPNDSKYRGNIYQNCKCIGDYITADSTEIAKAFPQLEINWN